MVSVSLSSTMCTNTNEIEIEISNKKDGINGTLNSQNVYRVLNSSLTISGSIKCVIMREIIISIALKVIETVSMSFDGFHVQ